MRNVTDMADISAPFILLYNLFEENFEEEFLGLPPDNLCNPYDASSCHSAPIPLAPQVSVSIGVEKIQEGSFAGLPTIQIVPQSATPVTAPFSVNKRRDEQQPRRMQHQHSSKHLEFMGILCNPW